MIRKILLINPSPPSPNGRNEVSLALLSIGNYLLKCFPEKTIELVDFRYERDNYAFSPIFKNAIASADVIGISCAFSEIYLNTIKVAKVCRKTSPSVTIIVGGIHPTITLEDFTKWPNLFDYVVIGHGEIAMEDIITHLEHRNFQSPQKQVIVNGTSLPKSEFFEIFDWTLLKRYFQQRERTPLMFLKFSSGCTGSCRFCSYSGKFRPVTKCISPQDAIKSLHDVLQFMIGSGDISHYMDRTGEITIGDEFFGLNRAWQQSFLARLIEKRHDLPIEDFHLNVCTRIDSFHENDMPIFDKAHVNVAFGIESFDPRMLQIMGKTNNPQGFLKKANTILRSLNCHLKDTYYTLYMVYGFPGETASSIEITDNSLQEIIEKSDNPTLFSPAEFCLDPSAEVYLNREEYTKRYGTKFYFPFWWREPLGKIKQSILDPSSNFSVFDLDAYFFSTLQDILDSSIKKFQQIRPKPTIFLQVWQSLRNKISNARELRSQIVKSANLEQMEISQKEYSKMIIR